MSHSVLQGCYSMGMDNIERTAVWSYNERDVAWLLHKGWRTEVITCDGTLVEVWIAPPIEEATANEQA